MTEQKRKVTRQELAEAAAAGMYADDIVAQKLAMKIEQVSPGYARISMLVGPDMVNGHGICHGGYSFILADTAFAYACNSHNNRAVAQLAEISFVSAVKQGARLTAVAEERAMTGRGGFYDVTVTDDQGKTTALFRGYSRQIKGELAPGLAASD